MWIESRKKRDLSSMKIEIESAYNGSNLLGNKTLNFHIISY